jgi:hypothetical protein
MHPPFVKEGWGGFVESVSSIDNPEQSRGLLLVRTTYYRAVYQVPNEPAALWLVALYSSIAMTLAGAPSPPSILSGRAMIFTLGLEISSRLQRPSTTTMPPPSRMR